MSHSDTEVVIIGGGAAGIAAGQHLRQAGVACLIVEARDRLGGRAWTVDDDSGFALDLGCGWLHSADRNPWSKIAERQAHVIDKSPPPWTRPAMPMAFSPAAQHDYRAALDAFYERVETAARQEPDVALAAQNPGLKYNHRRLKDADVYFFFNEGDTSVQQTATLATEKPSGAAEAWDADQGTIASVPGAEFTPQAARIPLSLAPWATQLIVLRDK